MIEAITLIILAPTLLVFGVGLACALAAGVDKLLRK